MKSYTAILIVLFCIELAPAITLAVLMRPKPWRFFLRGSEAGICLAFSLDTARRLVVIATGVSVPYPGTATAMFNVAILSVVDLLIWMRLAQWLRHRSRNALNARDGIQQLEDRGIDTTELRAKAGLTGVDLEKDINETQ